MTIAEATQDNPSDTVSGYEAAYEALERLSTCVGLYQARYDNRLFRLMASAVRREWLGNIYAEAIITSVLDVAEFYCGMVDERHESAFAELGAVLNTCSVDTFDSVWKFLDRFYQV